MKEAVSTERRCAVMVEDDVGVAEDHRSVRDLWVTEKNQDYIFKDNKRPVKYFILIIEKKYYILVL